ncbi:MAG TPA: DMT family transporter [Actinomycetota bacterium]|jgi:drug/metabolite transporter (DMT)-like permease|nr:DMT family transporter [Actinomycetota bacterium]
MLERAVRAHARRQVEGIGLAVVAAVFFGTVAIFAKLAYATGADPVPLLAFRFSIAGLFLVLFQAGRGQRLGLRRADAVRLLALGALGYAGEAALFFIALHQAPAGMVSLVFHSYPVWTALLGFATRLEPLRVRLLIALALALGGVALIFSVRSAPLPGLLVALAASVAVSFYYLGAQLAVRNVGSAQASIYTALGAAVALWAFSLASGQALPVAALSWGTALGAVTAIAFLAMYGSIRRVGSARSAIAQTLEPVTTVALAAMFLGENITWKIALGAVLIVASLPALVSPSEGPPAPDTLG